MKEKMKKRIWSMIRWKKLEQYIENQHILDEELQKEYEQFGGTCTGGGSEGRGSAGVGGGCG